MSEKLQFVDFGAPDKFGAHLFRVELPAARPEAVRIVGILLLPIMPQSAAEILRRVGAPKPAAEVPAASPRRRARW